MTRRRKRAAQADIDALADAVSPNGEFIPKPGEKVIVELKTETGAWLYTREFRVQRVESDGTVALYDETEQRCAGVNFHAVGPTMRLKLPAQKRTA